MSFIEYIDVGKSFGDKRIFNKLSLTIEKGETLTILGGSGSGKTVLLKILIGLIHPDSGRVLFEGRDIATMPEEELRKIRSRVGMLFQGGALFDSLSVKENVAYPLREYFDYPEDKVSEIVARKLVLVDLPGTDSLFPSDLSGGMKKRVALARAIATDPEVILYDEPTTGLDPINTRRIDGLILGLQRKLKVTSVVVTHDIQSALSISDRLAFLHEGRIPFVGTKEEAHKSKNPVLREFLTGDLKNADT